jgi:hypothetical protein
MIFEKKNSHHFAHERYYGLLKIALPSFLQIEESKNVQLYYVVLAKLAILAMAEDNTQQLPKHVAILTAKNMEDPMALRRIRLKAIKA